MWSYWICDTRSGEKQLQVYPQSGGSSARVLNDTAGGTHSFSLAETELTQPQLQSLFQEWARDLVVCWDDKPWYTGLITGTTWLRASKTLKVNHSDIRALLARRWPFGATSYWSDPSETVPGKLECNNLQLYSIASRVVAAGITGATDIYSLPIALPPIVAGPVSRTYQNYNVRTVVDILEEIQEEDGGPDIDFPPRWNHAGGLEWLMRTGTPEQPAFKGTTYELYPDAEGATCKVDAFARDALRQATGVMTIGEGQETDMLVAGLGLNQSQVGRVPALDTSQAMKSIDDIVALAAQSRATLALHRNLTQQFTIELLAGSVPGLTIPELGDLFRIWLEPDEWLSGGWSTVRVIGVHSTGTDWLTVDVQPWGA